MSTIGYINVSLETFGGLLSLIFLLCLYITRPQKEMMDKLYIRLLICNTALLFCDAAAWIFKGKTDSLSFFMVRLSNFSVYVLGYVMLVLFSYYLVSFLRTKESGITNVPLYVMDALMILAVCLVIFSQFNDMYYLIDEQNIYRRQGLFWLSQAFGITGMLINTWVLFHHRHVLNGKEIWALGSYISLPVTAMVFQILFYNIAVLYLATTICLFCIYISVQVALSQEASQKKMELEVAKTAVMLSQIQPHFLCNALVAIKELCDAGQQEATSKALEHFSFYLRGNLNSIANTQLNHFSKEVEHVKDYLYLEQMRFGARLNVQWDIGYTDFLLPTLTLQPIVENAVRHGIIKRPAGGTLSISSELTEQEIIITVADDGIGFDPSAAPDSTRPHIGIENVRWRLKTQCGGRLTLQSTPGKGTKATISITIQ